MGTLKELFWHDYEARSGAGAPACSPIWPLHREDRYRHPGKHSPELMRLGNVELAELAAPKVADQILARLAIDSRSQGEGLGARLLDDALERVCRAVQEVAVPCGRRAPDRRRSG